MPETVEVPTPRCVHCGKGGTITVPKAELEAFEMLGGPIQQRLTSLNADQREQIISGTHPACWDAMFAEPTEEP